MPQETVKEREKKRVTSQNHWLVSSPPVLLQCVVVMLKGRAAQCVTCKPGSVTASPMCRVPTVTAVPRATTA